MPEVRLVNVTKKFGKIVAVENLNLHVHDKEYLTLLGPSGCGKTTTLRLIAGLITPNEGDIYIGDKLVTNVPPEDRGIGYVFQTFALFPHMNVWDNVTYGPRVKGWERGKTRGVAKEILEMVKLITRTKAYPRELSGGMIQRVALARALTTGASLLLLDEPLGLLDRKIRVELRYELRRLVKDLGLTAIHVTHDQEEALTISDRVALMRRGKIEQIGTPTEIYLKPKTIFTANFVGDSNFLEGSVSKIDTEGGYVEVRGGRIIRTLNKEFSKGRMVVLAIRPERVEIFNGEKKMENGFLGRVEDFKFLGSLIQYDIRLENADLISVAVPVRLRRFDLNDRVTVYFAPDKVLVYKYPEMGLRRELEVE